MAVSLFVDMLSQPCRALVMFINLTNIPCELQSVAIRKGQHKTPEFLKLNPLGKLPVLKDGGFILTESVAIMRYLASKFKEDKLYPSNIQARAKVDEYLAWQHLNTRYKSAKVFLGEVVVRGMVDIPQAVNDMNGMLDDLEMMFLKDNKFLTGERLTVADIFAICELMQPTASGRDVFQGRTNLIEWKERVEQSTEPYFGDAHSVLFKVRKNFMKNKL